MFHTRFNRTPKYVVLCFNPKGDDISSIHLVPKFFLLSWTFTCTILPLCIYLRYTNWSAKENEGKKSSKQVTEYLSAFQFMLFSHQGLDSLFVFQVQSLLSKTLNYTSLQLN